MNLKITALKVRLSCARGVFAVLFVCLLSGCASYYKHYGSFSAENSAGEVRQFLLTWESADYPSWALFSDRSTPVTLTTQCSERKWQFDDDAERSNCSSEGIVSCGVPDLDLTSDGQRLPSESYVCGRITDDQGAQRIADLGRIVLLTMNCRPVATNTKKGKDIVNQDYLKPSIVPYRVSTKRADIYDMAARPPELSDNICDK